MVEYFKPTGRILEPCAGDGAFMKYLPTADWCEITKGRDFFACHEHYDWIIGNPPYGIFYQWLVHSIELGDRIVYLIPTQKCFSAYRAIKAIYAYGGITDMLIYGTGRVINFPLGFAVGAMCFRRGYTGPINVVFRERIA
jgi:hypothetical protein